MNYLQSRAAVGELVTGLLYVDPDPSDLHAELNTVKEPLNRMGADKLCPGAGKLRSIMGSYR